MISAYCLDGMGALHIVGTTGATCDGVIMYAMLFSLGP